MLYILRHAAAVEAASGGDDGARKLTERSKEKMRGAASGLRAMGLKFNVILTSPLVRAAETAGLVVITQVQPISATFTLPQSDLPRVAEAASKGTLAATAFSRTTTAATRNN